MKKGMRLYLVYSDYYEKKTLLAEFHTMHETFQYIRINDLHSDGIVVEVYTANHEPLHLWKCENTLAGAGQELKQERG